MSVRSVITLQPVCLQGHPLLQAEVNRVKEQKEMPGVDRTRFSLAAPMAQNDLRAWGSAVKNAKAQLEHQSTRRAPQPELQHKVGAHSKVSGFHLPARYWHHRTVHITALPSGLPAACCHAAPLVALCAV